MNRNFKDTKLKLYNVFKQVYLLWGCTFTVFHEDQDLPDAVWHSIDCGVQVANNVLMAWQLLLQVG